jgi:hypothetical protein
MFVIVELLYGTGEEVKEKRMVANNMEIHYICANNRYNNIY